MQASFFSVEIQEKFKLESFLDDTSLFEKLTLCLSGGIDSECMVHSFLNDQVPFEVVFLKFKNNLNMFDIKTNIEFCESINIKYKFIDLERHLII